MIYLGLSLKKGICPICKEMFPKGARVYHNTAKSIGHHLAHESCWDKLSASRPRVWGVKEPTLSEEKLDPPF